MFRFALTQALQGKEPLRTGFFRPQRAVIVEHGDTCRRGDIGGAARCADVADEIEDALLLSVANP